MEIQKQRFYEHLYERRKDVADNNRGLPMEKYCALIEEVKNAKVAERKSPRMHWLLKHYDVLLVQGMEKLIVPHNNESVDVIYYVHDDELFDILQEVHTSTGHGGRDRMMKKTKEKYKNIVRTEVLLFINLCVSCQTKQKRQKKGIVSKPTIFNDWNSRCQVDLIDYQSHADGKYRYVLVYQDHLTKFVILRPLETKRSEEVAYQLLDVFTMFGASVVLQSDNGRDFCSKIIEELKKLWPELKMVHGEPRQSQDSLECANQDVDNMLTTWMLQNETEHWSQGLRFVQFMKNSALHSGIKRSPYEAMFGRKPKIGLKTSNVPLEAIDDVTTEEHLENIVTFSCIDNSQTGQLESQQSAMDSVKTEKDLEEVVQLIDTDNAHTEHEQSQSLKSELSEDNDYCQKISYAMCSICFNPTNYEALNVENASSENICNCCNRETNKANVRKGALDGLEVQAKRMKVISDSTHPKSEIELTVKIPVPDISRGQGDARSVLAVVLGATADAFTAWVRNKE